MTLLDSIVSGLSMRPYDEEASGHMGLPLARLSRLSCPALALLRLFWPLARLVAGEPRVRVLPSSSVKAFAKPAFLLCA
jgi:hypothetical protein